MNKRFSIVCFVITACLYCSTSFATNLVDVYNDAVNSDPVYKAALSTMLSSKEVLPQARSGLLPQLVSSDNLTRNRQHGGTLASDITGSTILFTQNTFNLQLTQAIFNYANWMRVRSASAKVKQAEATYNAAAQDLIIRVATAYFNVLQAEDNLRFTESQLRANERQLDQARQRYQVGLDAITSVYNAQAAYDTQVAQQIADKNSVANQREALREITGKLYPDLAGIRGNLPLVRPVPNDSEAWVATATKQNYQLLANRFAMLAAKENIQVNFAGHLPTANVISSYNDNSTSLPKPNGTDTKTANVGVSLNFPIYQGGLVVSQTRQATYDFQTASFQTETIYRKTINTTRQTFNSISAGISKIKADRQAIKSAASSLDSTEASFKVGTRTIVDVLIDQKNLSDAQRIMAIDQYTYMKDLLGLKQAAGTLSAKDLQQLNAWLSTNKYYKRDRSKTKKLKKHRNKNKNAGQDTLKNSNKPAKLESKITTIKILKSD